MGWEWGLNLLQTTPRDFGYGIINHWIPAGDLRDLREIEERLVYRRGLKSEHGLGGH